MQSSRPSQAWSCPLQGMITSVRVVVKSLDQYFPIDASNCPFPLVIADAVIPITCFILVCLFALQHYGTHRIGFLFAPIVLTWLLCISSLGFYNILRWNPRIYKALSPYHMLRFIQKTRLRGWMSLGGILLCITGRLEAANSPIYDLFFAMT